MKTQGKTKEQYRDSMRLIIIGFSSILLLLLTMMMTSCYEDTECIKNDSNPTHQGINHIKPNNTTNCHHKVGTEDIIISENTKYNFGENMKDGYEQDSIDKYLENN